MLFVGTVSDGTFLWREDSPVPEKLPDLKRTLHYMLWHDDLYIADEGGLFLWGAKDASPRKIFDKETYQMIDGGNFLVVDAGDGIYRVDAQGYPVRLASKENHFGPVEAWKGHLYYGNADGLFVLDNPTPKETPRRIAFSGKYIEAIMISANSMLIQVRDDQIYVWNSDQPSPQGTGIRAAFHRGSLEWHQKLVFWGDDGVYTFDNSAGYGTVKLIAASDEVWGGVCIWGEDLVIGTNNGLLIWKAADGRPITPFDSIGRVAQLGVWKDMLLISETFGGKLWFWKRGAAEPEKFPLPVGELDSIVPWNNGLFLGDDENGAFFLNGAFFFDSKLWKQGNITIAPVPDYQVGQPIPFHWSFLGSPYRDLPVLRQNVNLLNADGSVEQSEEVAVHNQKEPGEFELTLKPVPASGNYELEVRASNIFGGEFSKKTPLHIKGNELAKDKSPVDTPPPHTLANEVKEFAQTCALYLSFLGAVYFFGLLILWAFAPYKFVIWHESISSERIPFSTWFGKFSLPWLLASNRCLDAVVESNIERAVSIFNENPDVSTHPVWVPAPLKIGDEQYIHFSRPETLPSDQSYTAGLNELRRSLPDGRFIICVEGPGGIGKSAFAFQAARWAVEGRLLPHRMLPMLIEEPAGGVDAAVVTQLAYLLGLPKISDTLGKALMRKKRIFALVDGLSEKVFKPADIRPESGSIQTHALLFTTRVPVHLHGLLLIQPQSVVLAHLDSVLSDYIGRIYGMDRFGDDQRETIRNRLREMIKESQPEGGGEAKIPMLVMALLVQQADALASKSPSGNLDALPRFFDGVVDGYVVFLLRDEKDISTHVSTVRKIATVCLGRTFVPAPRSFQEYVAVGVAKETLDKFAAAGLLVRTGDVINPLFKFALDPVAEYLASREYVSRITDGTLKIELFRQEIATVSKTAQIAGFVEAFNRNAPIECRVTIAEAKRD